MNKATTLFKALADPTRIRLATLLALNGETCVCMLAQATGEADFKVSRHLAVLRSAGIVEARREGTWMHYKLADSGDSLQEGVLDCLRNCLKDNNTITEDLCRLAHAACAK